jgi:hypothetical protein
VSLLRSFVSQPRFFTETGFLCCELLFASHDFSQKPGFFAEVPIFFGDGYSNSSIFETKVDFPGGNSLFQ